tara:strand:+ start:969 stop:1679 length:711 start_codon:yes stop_codon:yes gene_type:complete
MSEIYNKNAREKVLLEKAYTGIYNEEAVDVELDHWWDFDEHDVVLKVYHGALRQLPPAAGTPEYEANSEKIFTWLKGKHPQPDEYHPGYGKVEDVQKSPRQRHLDDEFEDAEMEFDERGFAKNTKAGKEDAEGALGNLAKGIGRGIGDVAKGAGRVGLAAGGAGATVAGGALGAALKIAKTLTADQLKKLGEYALEKSAEAEEDPDDDNDDGQAGAQEYDMDRDPQGRREADPREW